MPTDRPELELFRIKETLLDIANKCDVIRSTIHQINRVTDASMLDDSDDAILHGLAKNLFLARRKRDAQFEPLRFFSDPAWDLLLDLFIAHCDGKRLTVSGAGLASHTPTSTAIRWIAAMEKGGLIERTRDVLDSRRQFIDLTERGLDLTRMGVKQFGSLCDGPTARVA